MNQLQAMRKTVELMDGVLNKAFENGTGEEFSYLDKLDPSLQPPHVRDMLEVMESNDNPQHPGEAFSDAKMGRWLGWAQAAVVAMGLASLEDMKEINRAEPSPSTPTPAALLPCPFCGGEAEIENIASDHADRRFSVGCFDPDCIGYQSLTSFAREADASTAWNRRRSSPPPSGDVEARLRAWAAGAGLGSGEPVLVEAADLLASQAQTITQERGLRKAAEGERDEAIRLARDRGSDITIDVASTIARFRSRAADLEAQLAQLRKDAVEVVKPFADFVPDFFDDGYQDDDSVKVESLYGGLDLTLTVEDFRAARIFLNANDQGSDT